MCEFFISSTILLMCLKSTVFQERAVSLFCEDTTPATADVLHELNPVCINVIYSILKWWKSKRSLQL